MKTARIHFAFFLTAFLAAESYANEPAWNSGNPGFEATGKISAPSRVESFEESGTYFAPEFCRLRVEGKGLADGRYYQEITVDFYSDRTELDGSGHRDIIFEFESDEKGLLPLFDLGSRNSKISMRATSPENSFLNLKEQKLSFGGYWASKSIKSEWSVDLGPMGRHQPRLVTHYDYSTYTLQNGVFELIVHRRLAGDPIGITSSKVGYARCQLELPGPGSIKLAPGN